MLMNVHDTRCKICNSEYRREIERLLIVEGKSYQFIIDLMETKDFTLNVANISNHKNKHMMNDVDTVIGLSKSAASLIPPVDTRNLSPEDLLDYVIREAINGVDALKLLPTSHYTLNARNNFLSTIRQIAESRIKAAGTGDKDDITTLINEQLKARGLMVDVTPKPPEPPKPPELDPPESSKP